MRLSLPELSYLHSSLTGTRPLRADLRALTAFRPRSLQTDFLATANGSARITWAGGDVLVVIKAQIGDAVELAPEIFGGQIFVGVDGDDDSSAFLVETMMTILTPRQFSSYGVDLRALAITHSKAWHIYIDCVILASDVADPLDALSLAVRVALQTSLLPRVILEDIHGSHTYEQRAALMDIGKGRAPQEEKVFQVDDDWANAVPLIPEKDWWKLPIIMTANIVDKTVFFDATPPEILVCTTRYAIASVPLNPPSTTQKLVFCESVGRGEGYGSGWGIQPGELERVVTMAMEVAREIVEASDEEVQRIQKGM